ncbi:MAG: hypothetical protein ABI977_31500 [Acidobacteriota bacterium]
MCYCRLRLFAVLLCFCAVAPVARAQEAHPLFRVERKPVSGEAELLTIFGKRDWPKEDIPLVSVLFETLGDDDPSNDRPRYVWSLTYTSPTFAQRAAAAVPFFYRRAGSKDAERISAAHQIPPPIFDFKASRWRTVARAAWTLAQFTVIDDRGFLFQAAPRAYRRNAADHKQDHLYRALTVLFLLESNGDAKTAIPQLHELQARLASANSLLGRFAKKEAGLQIAQKRRSQWEQTRGHNWEMLRQRAEAEALYFEPLTLPDGNATHAMLWVAREDLHGKPARKFNKRFLNIADPYADVRLRDWKGYVETRWLDAENRPAAADAPGARKVELIPLAVYGLNHPRVPILLVDFREGLNPKGREISRRLIYDVTRNVFLLSPIRAFHWWAARKVFDVVMRRRGADINQPSRLRAYSELDLLLMLSDSTGAQLRNEISRRLPGLTTNPMENSLKTEMELARANYEALLKGLRKQR